MSERWDPTRGQVTWLLAGLLVTLVVAAVLYSFLGALVVGLFLYYAVRPVNRWFEQYSSHPTLNATLSLLLVGLPMGLVVGYAALVGARELNQLLTATGVQQYRAMLQPYLDLAELTRSRRLVSVVRANIGRLLGYASAVFTWLLRLFVVVVVAFYLLRDDDHIADWFRATFGDAPGAVTLMERVDDDLTTIYTGNLITIAITALIAVMVYTLLDFLAPAGTGIAFPLLLGLLTGVFTIIPALGIKLIYVPYTGYLLVEAVRSATLPLWFPVVYFFVVLLVVDSIPDFFIRSFVSKGDLHMGLVLLAYVLGTVAFGWYGIFLGPIVLVLFLQFLRTILPTIVQQRRIRRED